MRGSGEGSGANVMRIPEDALLYRRDVVDCDLRVQLGILGDEGDSEEDSPDSADEEEEES
jgi:hypothetical protein